MAEDWDELARTYHDEVITPFDPSVSFRLPADVGNWLATSNPRDRVVVDCGCGVGEALGLVAGEVGIAAGIDLSEGMLEVSASRLEACGLTPRSHLGRGAVARLGRTIDDFRGHPRGKPRGWLVRGDLRNLEPLRRRADLTLAINSICPSSMADAEILFRSIADTVNHGGRLITVFPSLDTMEHLFGLWAELGEDPSWVGRVRPDGTFETESMGIQKFFRPEEIEELHVTAGLRLEILEKIPYPWPLIEESGWGSFPDREPVWDWYAVGERP